MEAYRTIAAGKAFTGEITEKKSRFIGKAVRISSREEAQELLAAVRKEHYDARHNCSAWILRGSDGAPDVKHSSDDGEPSGTAGRPILDVLEGAGLKDVLLVVTRYFGGTLLGTGGLTRAYSAAAKAALENAEIVTIEPRRKAELLFDYAGEGTVRRFLENRSLTISDTAYSNQVSFSLYLPEAEAEQILSELRDLMHGKIETSLSETTEFL